MGIILSITGQFWESLTHEYHARKRIDKEFQFRGKYTLGSPLTADVEFTGPWDVTMAETGHRCKVEGSICATAALPADAEVLCEHGYVLVDRAMILTVETPESKNYQVETRPKVGELVRRQAKFRYGEPCILVHDVTRPPAGADPPAVADRPTTKPHLM